MTDNQIALRLEVIQEIAHLTNSTPDETLEEIKFGLDVITESLSRAGLDTAPLTYAWQHVQQLHRQADAGIDISIAAKQIAAELNAKLAEYVAAVHSGDVGHGVLGTAIETLRDLVIDDVYESGFFVTYCAGCEITNEHPDIPHDIALDFHNYLFDARNLTGTDQDALREFMVEFVTSVRNRTERNRHDH